MARAKSARREMSPRGTNILYNDFMEKVSGLGDRWKKAAGLAAIEKISAALNAMPDWVDPNASTKRTASTRSKTSRQVQATRRSSRSTGASIRGSQRSASSAAPSPAEANGTSHPGQG